MCTLEEVRALWAPFCRHECGQDLTVLDLCRCEDIAVPSQELARLRLGVATAGCIDAETQYAKALDKLTLEADDSMLATANCARDAARTRQSEAETNLRLALKGSLSGYTPEEYAEEQAISLMMRQRIAAMEMETAGEAAANKAAEGASTAGHKHGALEHVVDPEISRLQKQVAHL